MAGFPARLYSAFVVGVAFLSLCLTCGGAQLVNSRLNALWFPGNDLGEKVNNAIAAALKQGEATDGATIYIPSGDYTVTTPITNNVTGLVLYGDGNRTVLHWANTNGFLFTLGNGSPSTADHMTLRDLFIFCRNNANAILVQPQCIRVVLRDLRIWYAGTGIQWSRPNSGSTWAGAIDNVEISFGSNATGMKLYGFDTSEVANCRINGNLGATNMTGIVLDRTWAASTIRGCNIEYNDKDDLIITNCGGPVNLLGDCFETIAASNVAVRIDSGSHDINIIGCSFQANQSRNLLTINPGADRIHIEFCQFNLSTGAAILNNATNTNANIFLGPCRFNTASAISSTTGVSWSQAERGQFAFLSPVGIGGFPVGTGNQLETLGPIRVYRRGNRTQYLDISGESGLGSIKTAAGLPICLTPGGTESARFNASGGVAIGNGSDPGAGNLTVAGTIKAASGYLDASGQAGLTTSLKVLVPGLTTNLLVFSGGILISNLPNQ